MSEGRRCWLMKSEPDVFSIADLRRKRRAPWDGVRNYQARNFLRDEMQAGDAVLFYHSSVAPPGVAGVARVSGAARPDPTAWDPAAAGYDPGSTPQRPRWWLVDVEFVEEFPRLVSLDELRREPALQEMLVLRRGQRLSVQPVTRVEFEAVRRLARRCAPANIR